tara:strand:+ start:2662 stop:3087 length:426 start_codon:yes stop_codon:yes gene_type:complete
MRNKDAVTQLTDDIDTTIKRLGRTIGSLRRLVTAMEQEPDDETRIMALLAANLHAVLHPLRNGSDLAERAENLIIGAPATKDDEIPIREQLKLAISQENYEEASRLTDLLDGPNKPTGNPFTQNDNDSEGPEECGGMNGAS